MPKQPEKNAPKNAADKNAQKNAGQATGKTAPAKPENPATKHLREALERLHEKQNASGKELGSKGGAAPKDTKHGGPTTGRLFRHQGR